MRKGIRKTAAALIIAAGISFGAVFGMSGVTYAETQSGTDYDEMSVDPTGQGDGYAAILYDGTSGLPTSEANAIAETDEGFIWIGGYSGLIRYDGNSFYRYDASTGITSVVSLYVDSKQRLWIGTNDSGVAVMENEEITFFDDIEGLRSKSIRSIVEDRDGNMIIATTHGLAMVDTEMNLHVINDSQLNDEYICELRKDDQGVIFGETMSGAIFTYDDGKVKSFYDGNKLETGVISTVLPDPENPGYVYLGTENSEIYYGSLDDNLSKLEKIDVSPLDNINSLELMSGILWICSDNGIGMYDGERFIEIKNTPMYQSIDRMMADYEGNLWFASSRQGIMKIVPNEFSDINKHYGLESMVVNSTCRYMDYLLIGADSGLYQVNLNESAINRYGSLKISGTADSETEELVGKNKTLNSLLKDIRIRSVNVDSKNRIWISTFSDIGLIEYDDGKVKCFNKDTGLPSNRVRTVFERSDGVIMVAASGGLSLIDDDKIVNVYDAGSGLSNPEILTISEDADGKMYLGSDGDGIYIIDGKNVSHIGSTSGLTSDVILRIKRDDKRGLFWVVTSNSIGYLKNDTFTSIKNFPYSNNFDLYENKSGEMWIISSNGIYVAKTEDLLLNEEFDYSFYDAECGLPSVATANSFSELDSDGNLYVSGSSMVFRVNIDDFDESISKIKLDVPFVETDNGYKFPDENGRIFIPANTHELTIYPYVFTYSLKNPKITYMLEGFDKNETSVKRNELEPVRYTNLDGGTYTFKMKMMSNVSEEERSITITIVKEKAMHENLWFNILMVLLGVAVIAGGIILYFKRKEADLIEKEKTNRTFIREMVEAFAKIIDMKDAYTNGHSTRVAEYTAMLAKELGCDEDTVDKYYNIALLHDIGKIGIPPEVLNKPGKLTDEEFKIIKSHSAQGFKVLKDIQIMPELAIGAGAHHERPDGKGYPKGLKGEDIPRVAQIIAVADTFDAMYSDRPYRKRMNFDKAVSIIKEVSGTQLFPDVVDAFVRLVEKGEFRDPEDDGGGTFEDISNIKNKPDETRNVNLKEVKSEEVKKETNEVKTEDKQE